MHSCKVEEYRRELREEKKRNENQPARDFDNDDEEEKFKFEWAVLCVDEYIVVYRVPSSSVVARRRRHRSSVDLHCKF